MFARHMVPLAAGEIGTYGPYRVIFTSLVAFALPLFCAEVVGAAEKQADAEKEKEIPPPQELDLETNDGLLLRATYFPGTRGKESVPVILLHMWKGNSSEYSDLAVNLQAQGHAVLVPDLRGHGKSTRFKDASRRELDAAKMPPQEFGNMVLFDMKRLKDFLWEKNNDKELNIDKLCVVGAEMGASVALQFALYDANAYDWDRVFYGNLKVGQFVKALVLISPEWSFRGLQLRNAAAHPVVRSKLSVMIVVGKGKSRAVDEARRLHLMFKRYHPDPPPEKKADEQDLFYGRLDTTLQGTKILGAKGLNLDKYIAQFIYRRLVASREAETFAWQERKVPYR